jgi:DNA-binding NarL/FixJ family response regulator
VTAVHGLLDQLLSEEGKARLAAVKSRDPKERETSFRISHGGQRARQRTAASEPFDPDACPFSPRQLDVVRLAADGFTDEQIAERLSISTETAKRHMKLAQNHAEPYVARRSRTAIAVLAVRKGWIE